MATLAEQFPGISFAKYADLWLASIVVNGKPKLLSQQLQDRRIKRIRYEKLVWGGLKNVQGDFCLCLPEWEESEYDASTLGHELGHTFQYSMAGVLPNTGPGNEMLHDEFCAIEKFCDRFAEKWLEINGIDRIEACLRNERSLFHSTGILYQD